MTVLGISFLSAIISQTFPSYLIGPYKSQFEFLYSVKISLENISDIHLAEQGYMLITNSERKPQCFAVIFCLHCLFIKLILTL